MRRGESAGGGRSRGRAADAMAQPRVRDVDAAAPAQPRAPAEVEVLPLHEERLVEAAELEQQLAADEHRGAVGAHRRDDLGRSATTVIEVETRDVLAEEPAAGEGRARLDVARRVPVDLAGIGGEERRVLRRARLRAARGSARRARRRCSASSTNSAATALCAPRCRGGRARGSRVGARARRGSPRSARFRRPELASTTITSVGRSVCAVEAREAVVEEVLALVVPDHDRDVRHRRAPRTPLRDPRAKRAGEWWASTYERPRARCSASRGPVLERS